MQMVPKEFWILEAETSLDFGGWNLKFPRWLMSSEEDRDNAQQRQQQHDHQGDEAIAGDALFVSQGTQPLNAAGSQIADEPRISGGRPMEMIADPPEQRRQII